MGIHETLADSFPASELEACLSSPDYSDLSLSIIQRALDRSREQDRDS